MSLSRRDCLKGLAGLAAAGLLGCPRSGDDAQAVAAALLGILSVPRPDQLGRAWLESRPELDLSTLGSRLADIAVGGSGLSQALADRFQTDFQNGEVVRLEGWWLSRSEAELCAFLYLAASPTSP